MDRREQLKQLIELNKKKNEEQQKAIEEFQRELEELNTKRGPDCEYNRLYDRLIEKPDDIDLRLKLTNHAIKINYGRFLVWRGGPSPLKDLPTLDIEQPLFVSENVLTHAPQIKQSCAAIAITNKVDDICRFLHAQPTGIANLAERRFYPLFDAFNRSRSVKFDAEKSDGSICEFVEQPLYDVNVMHSSGTGQLNFFQIPLGGTGAGSKMPKTQCDTNMDQGGSLPYPKHFKITGISVIPEYETDYEDAIQFVTKTWFRLFIGTKDYLVTPSNMVSSIPTNSAAGVSMRFSNPMQPVYSLQEPLDLIPQQNFRVEINSPVPQVYSKNFRVMVVLHGGFQREVRRAHKNQDPAFP